MAKGGRKYRNQTNNWRAPIHNSAHANLLGSSIEVANFYGDGHAATSREAWSLQRAGSLTIHRITTSSALITIFDRLTRPRLETFKIQPRKSATETRIKAPRWH